MTKFLNAKRWAKSLPQWWRRCNCPENMVRVFIRTVRINSSFFLSFLSFGLATEVPELTHYWVVWFHPRASAKVTSILCPFIISCYVISTRVSPVFDWAVLNPPPRSIHPHWSHWPPVTPPPPFPFPILVSPSSFSSLQLRLCVPLLLPLFLSVPAPASILSRVAHTIVGGPVSPPRCSVTSQSPRIGRVAMNCATVFYLRRTDVRARTIPASLVAPARGRYIHFPSLPRRGMRPVRRGATLPWNASRAASILLVRTQVSALKRRTCCVTAI